MTAQTVSTSHPSGMLRSGTVLALALAALDIVGMLIVGLATPPVLVVVLTIVFAGGTLIGCGWSWRGLGRGTWLVVVTRLLATLMAIPLFFIPDAPSNAVPMAAVGAALTAVAIVMLLVGQHQVSRRAG
ncbi:hypothetical protein [Acidipropionibacterium jensenii]|uniref:hypothetical protein n=1 Tax=Acidipropionibacterium jensenii TaxID=1749 RepID=UPI000BC2C7BB|nr:hypothetical protein [Acidipropionibacterium jensenii]